jgi:hypothetical protein
MQRLKNCGALLLLFGLITGLAARPASAADDVIGVGRAPLSAGDASVVRAAAHVIFGAWEFCGISRLFHDARERRPV